VQTVAALRFIPWVRDRHTTVRGFEATTKPGSRPGAQQTCRSTFAARAEWSTNPHFGTHRYSSTEPVASKPIPAHRGPIWFAHRARWGDLAITRGIYEPGPALSLRGADEAGDRPSPPVTACSLAGPRGRYHMPPAGVTAELRSTIQAGQGGIERQGSFERHLGAAPDRHTRPGLFLSRG